MLFCVKAIDTNGSIRPLEIEAENEAAVEASLRRVQLHAISVRRAASLPIGRGHRSIAVDLFCQETATLLEAGLSLPDTLDLLVEKESRPVARQVYSDLLARTLEGARLSVSLQATGRFPPLLAAMVQSGEQTGSIAPSLRQYQRYAQLANQLRSRVISASIYPCVLLCAGTFVCLFLMLFVVPRFATLFNDQSRDIPWASKVLVNAGEFLSNHGVWVGLGCFAGAAFVATLARTHGVLPTLMSLALKIPGLARKLHLAQVSRLMLCLGYLLQAGLPLRRALQLAGSVLPPQYRKRVANAERLIEQGRLISVAFSESGLTTLEAGRLLAVGERSGQIPAMMLSVARYHDEEVERAVERALRFAEPVLLTLIGLVIGTVIVLLYLPVFELADWAR